MVLAEIDVGRLVAGKYELVRLIGKGAMGEVWLATHNSLGGEFAIKLVKPSDDEQDETAAGRFQLEAQISAKLSRKTRHIVSVSDHGEEDGLAYLVMELLEGESLEARIERAGEMQLGEAVAIVMQVARALGQAHAESIFHRDLKPANVFLTRDEDGRLLVKLLDFGIARSAKPFRTRSPFMTGKDMVLGTPSYMSPEQARGLDSLDHRCDLWALAVVAYESLTGTIPWDGDTVEDVFLSICTHRMTPILSRRANLPPVIEGVFARSFAPKLDVRFRTAAELSEAFEALVDPMEVEAALGARPSAASSGAGTREPGPASDPSGVAVEGATLLTKRKKSSGWLVAVLAALATIAIVVLAVTAFSSRSKTAGNVPGEPTTTATTATTTNDRASVPPPPHPPVVTPVVSPPSSATAAVVKATGHRATPRVAPPERPTQPTSAVASPPVTPANQVAPPALVAPAVTPPAPASPRTPGERSDVF